eukprot:CAMPEP_0177573282 /NCGR_PEP_ID=MMETSP0369-20130122/78448_1 /TAXON_ID=447022 ORGANISM="Scrippsiella hangoei-like, Strain SHHI-4" /NCGR_SAMPLE_ID=MMETSP0369 /ASSEMBLY_ACC=CAM_ASM_000364 /LENGTH=185 /DNA_ID=CAMNT_0019061391 /DNA_START=169 /DNA_END=724 /DNA_ORIENTATION=+
MKLESLCAQTKALLNSGCACAGSLSRGPLPAARCPQPGCNAQSPMAQKTEASTSLDEETRPTSDGEPAAPPPRPPAAAGQRAVAAAALGQKARHQVAGLDLSIALAPRPTSREPAAGHRDVDGGPAEGRPSRVLLVGLVRPLPDALAGPQLPRKGLLQPVLHFHQGRLALGHLQCAILGGIAGPI